MKRNCESNCWKSAGNFTSHFVFQSRRNRDALSKLTQKEQMIVLWPTATVAFEVRCFTYACANMPVKFEMPLHLNKSCFSPTSSHASLLKILTYVQFSLTSSRRWRNKTVVVMIDNTEKKIRLLDTTKCWASCLTWPRQTTTCNHYYSSSHFFFLSSVKAIFLPANWICSEDCIPNKNNVVYIYQIIICDTHLFWHGLQQWWAWKLVQSDDCLFLVHNCHWVSVRRTSHALQLSKKQEWCEWEKGCGWVEAEYYGERRRCSKQPSLCYYFDDDWRSSWCPMRGCSWQAKHISTNIANQPCFQPFVCDGVPIACKKVKTQQQFAWEKGCTCIKTILSQRCQPNCQQTLPAEIPCTFSL